MDWQQPDYSTTSWDQGLGGFGRAGTAGSVVRTNWHSADIWLRKWFQLDSHPPYLALDLHCDDQCAVYLNGVLVHEISNHFKKYQRIQLDERALGSLKVGRNVIAIHGHFTQGGQYIDAGLVVAPPRLAMAAALEQHGLEILGRDKVKQLADSRQQLEKSKKRKLPPVGTPVMAVAEKRSGPVHVLVRGNPHAKGDRVGPGVPSALRTAAPKIPNLPDEAPSSGKRLALARWMFQPDHPLTARVLANRIWQHHFGRGIVPTPNDFGKLGEPPTHPELLDWLACQLREGGWKLKRIHKLILLSSAWRMSSRATKEGLAKDPGNQWFWRFDMRRLSSEEIRDSILAVTGELNLKQGGPSIYVRIPQAVLQGQSRPGAGWGKSPPAEAARRSVYIHVKRSLLVPILEMHDQADTDSSCPVRYVTTVPTQSLGMLNGEFMQEKAGKLAERLSKELPNDIPGQVRRAIQLTTGRTPSEDETAHDAALVATLAQDEGLSPAQALKTYCLMILNTNEFVYLD
jgi:hypothetical protein